MKKILSVLLLMTIGAVCADAQIHDPVKWETTVENISNNEATVVITAEKYVSSFSGKRISRIGQKWSDMQASVYGASSQPSYMIVDHDGGALVPPKAFDLSIENDARFLKSGTEAIKKNNKQ